MANAQFLPNTDNQDAEEVQFEEYSITDAPMTSADHALDSLIGALNDVSDTARVNIHRMLGGGKDSTAFLDSFSPDKFTPDDLFLYIKNTYGAGDYKIYVRDRGKIRANKHISIEAPKSVSRETSNNGDIKELMAFMQHQQQQMLNLMREHQQPQQSEDQMIDRMLKYKALFGGGEHQKSQGFSEIIQTVNGLKELGINVGGIQTEEKEDSFSSMLENLSPVLTALVQNASNQPQPQPQPQYKPNPEPRKEPMNFELIKLKMGIASLVKAAAKNSDTAFYADFVCDQMADKINIVLAPNAIDELIKLDKKVGIHKEWFLDVLEHIKGMHGQPSKYADQYKDDSTNENNDVIKGEIINEIDS